MSDNSGSNTTETLDQRLWVVSELYYPEMTSTGYYLTQIAEGLADSFVVKVLCGQPNYSARGQRAPKHEFCNSVEIFRAAGTTLNKNVIIFRLVNMITLGISVFFQGLRRFRSGDIILVVTTPPAMPFVVAFAALLRGAQYTLLVHDNYPEILIAAGKTSKSSFLVSLVNFCNRWLYKHAARFIAVGRDMHELLAVKSAGFGTPISVIPNWAELETVEPRPREGNLLLDELRLADKFVFLYAGNMGHPNDIETIISAAEALRNDARFHFIFLGAGVKQRIVENAVSSARGGNITLLPPKPRAEQIVFLNACDIALVSLVPDMKGVSMPSRTYNILAAGKPILALTEPASELALVIDEEKCGWHLRPGDADRLTDLIRIAADDRELLQVMGSNGRRAALTKYSAEIAVKSYRRVLSDGGAK